MYKYITMYSYIVIFLTCVLATNALESRVHHGVDLHSKEHGYLIQFEMELGKAATGICSGSIITSRWIVSAAHCFPSNARRISALQLIKKTWRYIAKENFTALFVHPQYIHDDSSLENIKHDIALLKTASPIEFDDYVWPIKLSRSWPKVGHSALITGYGENLFGVLKVPRQGLVIMRDCRFINILCSQNKVRAGGGDSGGALVSKGKLVGITSAYILVHGRAITLYASVDALYTWISHIIEEN